MFVLLCSVHLSEDDNKAVYGKCNNPNGHGHNYKGLWSRDPWLAHSLTHSLTLSLTLSPSPPPVEVTVRGKVSIYKQASANWRVEGGQLTDQLFALWIS